MKQIQARKLEEALGGLADLPSPTEMEGKPAVRNEETPLALPETVCIVDGSTEQQRLCESSRRGVLAAVERVMAEAGVSKEAAITTVLTQAKMPGFEHIAKLFSLAADGRGGGGKLPSVRTIKRWFAARERNSLAPKMSQKDMNVPSWLPLFMECYRLPMKPSVAEAYRFFLRRLESDGNECPSIHTVRRWLDKVGNVERERGRRGARDLKNILPHKRRDFMHLKPAAIYTADGHTFDAEVLNPLSGLPFRPEITTVLDVGTRRCMGWSVGLAESRFTVLEALSHASRAAIGALWYVDWGKGFENLMMTDEATGLMGRLGMTMTHSRAYPRTRYQAVIGQNVAD
ncbi:bacteriophage transposase [Neisseria elongata]|uniref:Bacteriophage transposase n=2 Tax=Neisseria elongata TaxID=495 RepID=A0A378TXR8_NEIEL|nr:putative transposase [Neisseria elongata subsp. elongata]STZ66723.1 bacteriophage transposase [Neisseria elongata]